MHVAIDNVLEAATSADWRAALVAARACPPTTLGKINANRDRALGVAWVSLHASHAINLELRRILAAALPEQIAAEGVPAAISDILFQHNRDACRRILVFGRPETVTKKFIILALLPGANKSRAAEMRDILDSILRSVVEAQSCIRGQSDTMTSDRASAYLGLAAQFYSTLAMADLYPGLARTFLRSFLSVADTPSLRHWRFAETLLAWEDLTALASSSASHREFTPAANDWLQQVIRLDPEPFAPGEFLDDQ